MSYFHTSVMWDTSLTDVEVIEAQASQGVFQELVVRAYKMSGTIPTNIGNKYIRGAVVTNLLTGVVYRNNGTTGTPLFTVWPI